MHVLVWFCLDLRLRSQGWVYYRVQSALSVTWWFSNTTASGTGFETLLCKRRYSSVVLFSESPAWVITTPFHVHWKRSNREQSRYKYFHAMTWKWPSDIISPSQHSHTFIHPSFYLTILGPGWISESLQYKPLDSDVITKTPRMPQLIVFSVIKGLFTTKITA